MKLNCRCEELGLLARCKELPSRAATDEEILRAHSIEHLQVGLSLLGLTGIK